jgi:hypothetical protein
MKAEKINEKVSVITVYSREKGTVMPFKMRWHGRDYVMTKLAYHHKSRVGVTIIHVFHVSDGNNDFRLLHNSDTLAWILEEVVHGN